MILGSGDTRFGNPLLHHLFRRHFVLLDDLFLELVHVAEHLSGGVQARSVLQALPLLVLQLVAAVREHGGAVFKAQLVFQAGLFLVADLVDFPVDQGDAGLR